MAYRSRGSRLPALSKHNAESIYWSAFDDIPHIINPPRSRRSSNINSTNSRHYIDPWDLENYAYIQRFLQNNFPVFCFFLTNFKF